MTAARILWVADGHESFEEASDYNSFSTVIGKSRTRTPVA